MMHKARKRFGQNFLHDRHIIGMILGAVQAAPGQHLVEIGPGRGALTEPLLKQGAMLDVVELDRDLVEVLRKKFSAYPNLILHSGDALRFDFARCRRGDEKLRIIGNLPYNISTPLLFHLFEFAPDIEDMHFMLQKEVVARMCAVPGNKQYGKLSIMLQYHCLPEALFDVPPESFEPVPKVMSAVVKLTPHRSLPYPAVDYAHFNRLVTQAFSQRRKTLRNALKDVCSEQLLLAVEINPEWRPECIGVQQYVHLSNRLCA
ncbi:MAG: 16S rRNA (adenine(1518)-N(6)/adenine(1519)-N(6))-dimethyltransferase RsmA [Gammaproteobacteria bacterium]